MMRIITDIKYLDVDRDIHNLEELEERSSTTPIYLTDEKGVSSVKTTKCVHELIKGRYLCTPNGDYVYGLPKRIQQLFELNYKNMDELEKIVNRYQITINRVKYAKFWTRLKWVFTGIKV